MLTHVPLGLRRVPGIDPEMDLSGSGACLAWYEVRASKARAERRAACRGEPEPALPVLSGVEGSGVNGCLAGSDTRRRYETSRLDSPR